MNTPTFSPKSTAVVLIDLQNAIASRDTAPYHASDVISRSKQIADTFRAAGSTIVFVHVDLNHFLKLHVDEPTQLPPGGLPASAMDIVPAAGKQSTDLLITKPHWGAFAGTDLEKQLRSRGITTIILAGIATNMGVESTLRQGTGLGFHFITVEDACATFSADMQNFAFKTIFPRLSQVKTTEQVLSLIA